ncbi:hypothetical protein [Azospirillum sp. sgz302134]
MLPKRGRGAAILFRFFAHGGRQMVLRVPVAGAWSDGLRTAPVLVTLQPDGDVLIALPREEVESGRFDDASARRLTLRLRQLVERTTTANPLWGVDAAQALGEIAGAVSGVASGVLLLRNGFEELTTGTLLHAGGTVAALAAPVVLATVRPWVIKTVVPRLFPLAEKVGQKFA